MKKCLISAVALLLFAGCFSSCKKECICTVTRSTPSTSHSQAYEMGRMDAKDCAKYSGVVEDGEDITRTLECAQK